MAPEVPWSPAEKLAGDLPGSRREPALAVMGTTPHLVFSQGSMLYHAYRKGNAWVAPARMVMGIQPALAVTADGRLHCLYANPFGGSYEIYYTAWNGQNWSLPQRLCQTPGDSTHPALAVGPGHSLHAAWADTTPGYSTIYYGAYDAGYWSALPIPNGSGLKPTIGLSVTGDIHVAWQGQAAGSQPCEVLCAICHEGAWGLPAIVSDSPAAQSLEPSLVVDGRGICFLAWQEAQGSIFQIFYSQHVPDGWTASSNVSAGDQDCSQPRLVMGPGNLAELTWLQAGAVQHRTRRPDADAYWKDADSLAAPAGPTAAADLAVAVGADGYVHVAWTALAPGGDWSIYYAQHVPALDHRLHLPLIGA